MVCPAKTTSQGNEGARPLAARRIGPPGYEDNERQWIRGGRTGVTADSELEEFSHACFPNYSPRVDAGHLHDKNGYGV